MPSSGSDSQICPPPAQHCFSPTGSERADSDSEDSVQGVPSKGTRGILTTRHAHFRKTKPEVQGAVGQSAVPT